VEEEEDCPGKRPCLFHTVRVFRITISIRIIIIVILTIIIIIIIMIIIMITTAIIIVMKAHTSRTSDSSELSPHNYL
jgi:hypothetical protein